ncbi:MAG: hypothetical protein ACRBG0_25255 [Lewinella sp.]|jgi:hypothetical protein|uniref:hypothetical protein n=1 Tax=Lewinella sp. TaxID=2004506 RepID=UPI003D6A68B1
MTNYKYLLLAVFLPMAGFAQNTISGDIVLPNALPVCNVLVELIDQNNQVLRQDFSEEDGTFALTNVPDGTDYTLRFFKEGPYLNGTSTFDLVLIARMVLGIDPLTPYALWAGDVNGSGTLTTLDMILIRKLILQIDTAFIVPSWGFDEVNAPGCDNLIEIPSLTESLNVSVVGVKRGDINNSTSMICQ